MEARGQPRALAALPSGKEPPPPDSHWRGGLVGPRSGLDILDLLPLAELESRMVQPVA
jgi:hypothetical protein